MSVQARAFAVAGVAITALVITGCRYNYRVPDVSLARQAGEYSANEKLGLAVNLCLSEELKATKWELHFMGATWATIAIGEQLAKNSAELAGIVFERVVVTNTPVAAGTGQVDAYLIPRVVAIDRSLGATAFGESIFTVVLEWRMEDRNHDLVWVDSIKGEGRNETGNSFTHSRKAEEQVEMLLNDLFLRSFRAIRASPEIGRFASRK